MPRFVSYLSWLTVAVAAAFLVVATAAFSLSVITTLAFRHRHGHAARVVGRRVLRAH
jgi:hypothetical protein